MRNQQVVILGAGGVGIEISEFIQEINKHSGYPLDFLGFLDDNPEKCSVDRTQVLGKLSDYSMFPDVKFICSIGSAQDPGLRKQVISRIGISRNRWLTLVHPKSYVSVSAIIEPGVVIYPGCTIGAKSVIGLNSLLAYSCSVGHESVIDEYCVLASKVTISGDVVIGECSYVSPGVCISQGIKVGAQTMIGIGSNICRDIPPNVRIIHQTREFVLRRS